MRRVFLGEITSDFVTVDGDQHKHLSLVLRAKKGQKIELCDGSGTVFLGEITAITRDKTEVKIIEKRADTAEPLVVCDLFLGLIKGAFLEIAVQKSVELGAYSVCPILTENTVKTDLNQGRIQKIALEAAKQCGRGRVPVVCAPVKLSAAFDTLKNYDLVVFPYENASRGIKEFLESSDLNHSNSGGKRVAVVIGPEGGFSKSEAEQLSKITQPVSLGRRILRTDTAATAAITAVMYHLGELERRG